MKAKTQSDNASSDFDGPVVLKVADLLPKLGEVQGDVIVVKKSTMITLGIAFATFVLGAFFGYFVARSAFDQGVARAGGAGSAAAQGAPAQPTQPPARLRNVSPDDDPALGPEDAPVTVIEFSDFQCPYCKSFRDNTFDALQQKYGNKIRFVYRDFPLTSIHPEAMKAAEAADCANEQGKFWEIHDLLFSTQASIGVSNSKQLAQQLGLDADKCNQCLDSDKYAQEVQADMNDGNSYGVTGTPTFFINGVRLIGAQPLSAFTSVIDQELGK